ncbi:MAG TPA: hypothetical protein DCS82_11045 [Rhodospirillaceae bacterium]|nr:hypothetical protein [Rhodospirillaceae bacterium]HAT36244.1 hypothetical protein [Rhodospirillaceae bacterium]|tara:strand:- start:50 stop:547 length:498 start_codon:yes stop_codon:yes gene_type:complete
MQQMSSGYLNKPVRSLFEATLAKELDGALDLDGLRDRFKNHRDGVLITSTDRSQIKILYCNESLERISGHDAATLIGNSPSLLHGPNTKKCVLDHFRDTLYQQREAHMTVTQCRKNGEEFTAEVLAGYVELDDTKDDKTTAVYISLTRETGDGVPPLTFEDVINS